MRRLIALPIAAVLALAGCATTTTPVDTVAPTALWDSTAVHSIELDFDQEAYATLLSDYIDGGEKTWMAATVTIDGTVIENVGLKLKGNSTLKGVNADSDAATLPWILRFDKYVDGQTYEGESELIVRGNVSSSSLNEAVALDLLGLAGLATEEAVSSRLSANGGASELRLIIQSPTDEWYDQTLDGTTLYKAEAGGDYTYRGDELADYEDIFDIEAGEEDVAPLATFLEFLNVSDDATFAANLDQYLDIESFATYLAYQDLVDNYDDIDGPGNNSYLSYDASTGLMTVVNWDLNLTFGVRNAGYGGGQGGAPQGDRPAGGGQRPGAGGNAMSTGNILSERFLENVDFAGLVDVATADLTATLFTSGAAQDTLDAWAAVLTAQAGDLVPATTIAEEAAAIEEFFAQG